MLEVLSLPNATARLMILAWIFSSLMQLWEEQTQGKLIFFFHAVESEDSVTQDG